MCGASERDRIRPAGIRLASPRSVDLTTLCHAIALGLAGYLLLRAVIVLLRVRWAHHAFPREGSLTAGEPAAPPIGDRARGMFLGAAVGDALGLPAESLPPWLIRLRYPSGARPRRGILRLQRRACEISDDTQLMIAVARSIDPAGRYLHARFLDELRLWRGYRIAAGRACSLAAARLRADPDRPSGVASEGNGAAMRVAPLALAHARDPSLEPLLASVDENARSTHTGELALAAARLVALLLWRALRGDTVGASTLRGLLPELCSRSGFPLELVLAPPPQRPGGHVVETIPAVLAPLLDPERERLPARDGFERAIATTFAAGGDVDTIGAIVGAVLGASHGTAAIPEGWLAPLHERRYLVTLADRLAAPSAVERAGVLVEVEGELATREVDAVVNAWNRNVIPAWLLVPKGVAKAIRSNGGRAALRAISRRSPMPLGSAWETGAGDLPARFVIHVAGIDLIWRASERSVSLAARNALLLARCLGASSVALPLIGAGSGGLPEARARTLLLAAMEEQRASFDRLELVRRPA